MMVSVSIKGQRARRFKSKLKALRYIKDVYGNIADAPKDGSLVVSMPVFPNGDHGLMFTMGGRRVSLTPPRSEGKGEE